MSDSELLGADSSTYANVFSYLGLPLSRRIDDTVDAVVMGVPYDLATSARAGARSGPSAIRQASVQLRWEEKRWPWRFSLRDATNIVDYGDLSFGAGDSAGMVKSVVEHADRIFSAGKFLLTFGGDHFILQLKTRDDIEIIEVTFENRDFLPDLILKKISQLSI